jgi:hypothetical protein
VGSGERKNAGVSDFEKKDRTKGMPPSVASLTRATDEAVACCGVHRTPFGRLKKKHRCFSGVENIVFFVA